MRYTCRHVAYRKIEEGQRDIRERRRGENPTREREREGVESIKMRRIALFCLLVCLFSCDSGIYRDWIKMATALGGISDSSSDHQNSLEIEELARFAVEEHNKKENALLEFVRVVKAKEQTVAGKLHHLTLEAIDAGKKKLYEAKVWVKAWENFKELQEFKHTGDSTFTRSDLGAKQGDHKPGWKTVSADDPVVQDAANHAVKTIQQRSNSLAPYELLEVVDAKAEVIEDSAKFDMLLKLKRGSKEEKLKVEVHKNIEGTFHLNQMQPHEHAD